MRRCPLLLPFAVALGCSLAAAVPAGAGIVDCSGPSGFKVLLDEPRISGEGDSDPTAAGFLQQELFFLLQGRKEQEWVEWLPEEDSQSVSFVLCREREPAVDGSDFDREVVDLLYNDDVLVELFASLRATPAEAGRRRGVAHLGFVVVPVRQLHFEGEAGPDGIFRSRVVTAGERADFLELFEELGEVDVFVAAALGLKAARRGEYEAAHRGLCKGVLLLGDGAAPGLGSLLEERLAHNLGAARSDPAYRGSLELVDPARPCPEASP